MKMKMTVALVGVLALALMAGCASGPKGPTDEELVKGTITAIKDAVLAKNVDKIMATIADSFYHPEVGDKAALKDLALQGLDMIDMSTAQVDLTKMQVKIDGDKATAYPIAASAAPGSVTVSISLQKVKTGKTVQWLITGGDAEGI